MYGCGCEWGQKAEVGAVVEVGARTRAGVTYRSLGLPPVDGAGTLDEGGSIRALLNIPAALLSDGRLVKRFGAGALTHYVYIGRHRPSTGCAEWRRTRRAGVSVNKRGPLRRILELEFRSFTVQTVAQTGRRSLPPRRQCY